MLIIFALKIFYVYWSIKKYIIEFIKKNLIKKFKLIVSRNDFFFIYSFRKYHCQCILTSPFGYFNPIPAFQIKSSNQIYCSN